MPDFHDQMRKDEDRLELQARVWTIILAILYAGLFYFLTIAFKQIQEGR